MSMKPNVAAMRFDGGRFDSLREEGSAISMPPAKSALHYPEVSSEGATITS